MTVGLIDVDGHKFPNLALMKISAHHKRKGDDVEWCVPLKHYDIVYQSKVFDDTYSKDIDYVPMADKVIKGGTGYGIDNRLSEEIEHEYPDYNLYPELSKDTAYGFLTRGCPRGCGFCIVSKKEGGKSTKVAAVTEFWSGQKNIKLLDANLLACPEHNALLRQLEMTNAYIDFTQGLDARLITAENAELISQLKIKEIHFAWDSKKDEESVLRGLRIYAEKAKRKPHGYYATVYVLTNYDTEFEYDLYRICTLRAMRYNPYVMIYDKPSADKKYRQLQRWCNNRIIFNSCDFDEYVKGCRKMTNKEIIKALECCIVDDCDHCGNTFGNCQANLMRDALGLINRQLEEIDRANEKVGKYQRCLPVIENCINDKSEALKKARAEAIKEYVKELKCAINPFADMEGEDVWKIADEVAREMAGEDCDR